MDSHSSHTELDRLRRRIAELESEVQQRSRLEAERLAVQTLRGAVLDMRQADDLKHVAAQLRRALQELCVPFDAFGINVVAPGDRSADSPVGAVHAYTWREAQIHKPLPPHQAALVQRLWRQGTPSYRPDLLAHDEHQEQEYLSYWGIRAVLDVPFSHGTVAVSSRTAHAFAQQDIDTLVSFSQVLAEGFQRMDHFQALDQRSAALEREMRERRAEARKREVVQGVRDEIWGMGSDDDIASLVAAVRRALVTLDVPLDGFSINIRDVAYPVPRFQMHSLDAEAGVPVSQPLPAAANETLTAIWMAGETAYRADVTPDQREVQAGHLAGAAARCVLDVPFPYGTLAVAAAQPEAFQPADIVAVEELTEVLAEGFQRREDLQRLAASEKRFRTLVETPPDIGVMFVDGNGQYLYVSPQIERMTGYPAEMLYADPGIVAQFIHPDDFRAGEATFYRALRGTPPPPHEFRYRTGDGEYRWASETLVPITADDGSVEAVQIIVRDITSRKEAEAAQREIERLRVLAEAAGGAAHEIMQPLQVIVGVAELLRARPELEVPCRQLLDDLLDHAGRVRTIVDNMRSTHRYSTRPYSGGHVIVDYGEASRRADDDT